MNVASSSEASLLWPERACDGRRGEERQRRSVSRVLCPERVTQGDGHLSRTPVARRLKRPNPRARTGRPIALLFGLAPGGVCLADAVTRAAGELLPHRFTLTASRRRYVSVALSVGSPPLAVSQHPALRSPDFPPAALPRPATVRSSLAPSQYTRRTRRRSSLTGARAVRRPSANRQLRGASGRHRASDRACGGRGRRGAPPGRRCRLVSAPVARR